MDSSTRPQKTALIVAQRLVDDIARNGNTFGDRLQPEKVMLEKYRVGRGTLREALRYLELQGILSLKPGPGGGPTIEEPDASHLANSLLLLLQFSNAPFSMVVEARLDLEPIMARHAAERMEQDGMRRLEDSVERMRSKLGDRETFLDSNREFHEIIAWASGNSMYGFLIDALIGIVDGTPLGVDYPNDRRKHVLAAHERILTALQAHDGDSSHEAMAEHMASFLKYMQRRYSDALQQTLTWQIM